MIRVIKKDGTKEDFNVQKVVVAVNKSAYRALIKFTDEELDYICRFVEEKVQTLGIQDVPIAGLGWMPVEVVPGLYTETYTDQLVEGKPSYRVNTVRDENGADTTDQGTGNGTGKSETKVIEKHTWKTVPGVIVLVLYGLFLLYLILELQRAARIKMRKNLKKKYAAKGQLVEWYVDEIENLFAIGGVKGDLTDLTALFEEVKVCFPGIREEEYSRSGGLIQKYRFGGMELMPHELRVLRGMTERFRQCLYKKQHFPGKLRLRYFYAR